MMELKPIKTEREYRAALKEAESLWDAPKKSAEADRLEVLVMLIQAYEEKHYAISAPEPIEFLHYLMESRGLTRKDLEPYIGTRGRVAEVLNRARPLSLEMIRRLSEGLNIPADILVRRYETRHAA
jgi:HTH-type transcriptional regulator/antitoxin HigA